MSFFTFVLFLLFALILRFVYFAEALTSDVLDVFHISRFVHAFEQAYFTVY
jgi:hypothetical protein